MTDILDLDALVPEPRQIILNGKTYECLPITIEQMIILGKLMNRIKEVENDDEIKPLIFEALKPIVPKLDNVDLTIAQLLSLIEFAQKPQVTKENTVAKDYDVKKNPNSPEESPPSSDSTPPTQ